MCEESNFAYFVVEAEKKREAKQQAKEAKERELRKREKAEEKERRRKEYDAQKASKREQEKKPKKETNQAPSKFAFQFQGAAGVECGVCVSVAILCLEQVTNVTAACLLKMGAGLDLLGCSRWERGISACLFKMEV